MTGKTTTERREHFHRLIAQAEQSLKQNPRAYRRKLGMLAGLGYCYIFGVLFFTLMLIGLCVLGAIKSPVFLLLLIKKKLIIVLIGMLYVLIKALWVKLDAPKGYLLRRKEYPELYHEIDAIGQKLKAPRIHEIILNPEFNAAIAQTPRLGIFGWQKNTLILGLSLMLGLSREQFLAVVAHEFGHLSGNHSQFGGWIYRVRLSWMRIMDAFDAAGGWAHVIFGRFFDWYAPYFNAYSFALARSNEYEADALAAEVTSRQALVEALSQTQIAPGLMQKHYWSDIEHQVGRTENVNSGVYSSFFQRLREQPFARGEARELLERAIQEKTGHTDTHPAFRDRIRPYAKKIATPAPPAHSAAEELFGTKLPILLEDFDKEWAEQNREWWKHRHQYLRESKQELQALEQKQSGSALDGDELFKLAALTEEHRSDVDPLPYYQACLEKNPGAADGNYAVGRLLLNRDDPAGVAFLDHAMSNRHAVIPACELAYGYFKAKGDATRAEQYRLRAEKHIDLQNRAIAERADLYPKDEFLPAELGAAWIEHLKQQFQTINGVREAWICRKRVDVFPEEPIYLIVYRSKWGRSYKKMDQAIVRTLQMPAEYFVINKHGHHRKLAKKALKIATQIL